MVNNCVTTVTINKQGDVLLYTINPDYLGHCVATTIPKDDPGVTKTLHAVITEHREAFNKLVQLLN